MQEPHDCLAYLVLKRHEWIEPHGEPSRQEWMECTECGEKYDNDEIKWLIAYSRKEGAV